MRFSKIQKQRSCKLSPILLTAVPMDAVSTTNEVVSLFSALRVSCQSVTERIDNFRGNRQQFMMLKDEMSLAEQKINVCSRTLKKYCEGISTECLEFEVIDVRGMIQTMKRVQESVIELEKKLTPRRRVFKEVTSANRFAEEISQQVQIIREMSSRLREMNEKLKEIGRRNDLFSPDFSSAPKLSRSWYLDFSTRETIEGEMMAKFLENVRGNSAGKTQCEYDHVTAVVGVAGMGGVGKTTALVGLAQHPEIRDIFSGGGIYFLVVGKDASPSKLVTDLKEMVIRSGGKKRCKEIDSNGSLESAVRTMSSWFKGRKALFILDDLWQTSSNQLGYFKVLTGLLHNCPESHMLISTRSDTIAMETSTRIEFEPRESTGSEAYGMFLASADINEAILDSKSKMLVEKVLKLCGGVPLMLSIAGAQVRRRRGTHVSSLERLLRALSDERLLLSKERQPGQYPSSFNQAVKASLGTIADDLERTEKFIESWDELSTYSHTGSTRTVVGFVMDCFHRLCVLPANARVLVDVIFGIWGCTNKTIFWSVIDSLVDFHLLLEFEDVNGNSKYGLHDIILEYCVNASQRNAKYTVYHHEFLSNAWKMCCEEQLSSSDTATEGNCEDSSSTLTTFWLPESCEKSRSWWRLLSSFEKLPEMKEYILQNLFRHLTESVRLAEAAGLISHMGWTKLRLTNGGINALNSDFSFVANAMREHPVQEHYREACDDALQGIMKISSMIGLAWPLFLTDSECLPTHIYGYLLDSENKLLLVERYLRSATEIVSGPWLKPNRAFWRMVESSNNHLIFRTAERIVGVAIGSKNIMAVFRNKVFWIDIETMILSSHMVVGNESKSPSEVSSVCFCELEGILVLAFTTGELELRHEKDGNIIRKIPAADMDGVNCVAISANGETVVSGSRNNTIRLWNVNTGAAVCNPLRGHTRPVNCVAISADGQIVVSGSEDKTIRLWSARIGDEIIGPLYTLYGHTHSVTHVAISPNGRTVVSGSRDGIRLWGSLGLNIHRDIRNNFSRFDFETTCKLWNNVERPTGKILEENTSTVSSVAFSTDGRTVVSGSDDKALQLRDLSVRVYNHDFLRRTLRGHKGSATCVAIRAYRQIVDSGWNIDGSADRQIVVSGSLDKTIRLWKIESSADRQIVVSGSLDKTIRPWKIESSAAIGKPLCRKTNSVKSVTISTDGRTVVSGSGDKTVQLWNALTGTAIGEALHGHDSSVNSVAISHDGRIAVSGSDDETVRLWNGWLGTPIGGPLHVHHGPVLCVAISADGRIAVSGSDDRTARLWDVELGVVISVLRGHEDHVTCVAISADGQIVVSGSKDMTIRLWDARSGTEIRQTLRGHESHVNSVAISADGRTAVSGSDDKTVRLWDVECGLAIGKPLLGHESPVQHVTISAEGQKALSRSSDGSVRLWSRNASETRWHCSAVFYLSVLFNSPFISFVERDQSSEVQCACFLSGVLILLELIQ